MLIRFEQELRNICDNVETMNVCEKEAAKQLGIAVQTLRNWRHIRKGPAYIKLGRSVRYRVEDILDFIEKNRIDPNAV